MRFSFEADKENEDAIIWDPVRKVYIRARDKDRFSTGNTSARLSTSKTDINIISLSSTVRPVLPLRPENINTNFINSNGIRERRRNPYNCVLNGFSYFQVLDCLQLPNVPRYSSQRRPGVQHHDQPLYCH